MASERQVHIDLVAAQASWGGLGRLLRGPLRRCGGDRPGE